MLYLEQYKCTTLRGGGGGREGNIGDKEINAKSIQLFLLEVVFYEKLLGRAFAAGRSSFDP